MVFNRTRAYVSDVYGYVHESWIGWFLHTLFVIGMIIGLSWNYWRDYERDLVLVALIADAQGVSARLNDIADDVQEVSARLDDIADVDYSDVIAKNAEGINEILTTLGQVNKDLENLNERITTTGTTVETLAKDFLANSIRLGELTDTLEELETDHGKLANEHRVLVDLIRTEIVKANAILHKIQKDLLNHLRKGGHHKHGKGGYSE